MPSTSAEGTNQHLRHRLMPKIIFFQVYKQGIDKKFESYEQQASQIAPHEEQAPHKIGQKIA